MSGQPPIDSTHETTRTLLRVGGPLLAVIGGLFMLVGFVDFFSSFGSSGPSISLGPAESPIMRVEAQGPQRFWCFFVGMPLLGIGLAMTRAGYMGAIARYTAGELAPVATDTVNYAVAGTKESIREVAHAVAEGVRGVETGSAAQACPHCGRPNASDARFCSACGRTLVTAMACPACGRENAADAHFCDHCGQALKA